MVLKVLALIILLSYLIGIIISMEILLENRDPSMAFDVYDFSRYRDILLCIFW